MSFWKKYRKLHIWLAVDIAVLGLYLALRQNRQLMNSFADHVTTPLKAALGRLCALTSLSVMEVLYILAAVVAVAYTVWSVIAVVKARGHRGRRVYSALLGAADGILTVYVLFCLMWGVNYWTDSFQDRSGITAQPVAAEDLKNVTAYFAERLSETADTVPRDENGVLQKSNAFDNRFLMTGNDIAESAQNKITVEQAEIPHDSYLATYITALDLCLQGIVSPSTLGIDVKKLDNAEAQREKEKTTLYTRQDIVNALQRVLPKLITDVFYAYQTANGQPAEEVRSAVTFGEYANPSFESQVETVAKAKQGGIMSIEAGLDELYGSTKSDTWKAAEAERIRTEQGIVDMEEPAVSSDGWAGIA